MNSTPEQNLERFRLAPPSPELRARVLAAARQEWDKPVPVSAWQSLQRPLLAIAASLVIAAAGGWGNHRLAAPAVVASAPPAEPAPFIHPGAKYVIRKAAMATLGPHQRQSFEIFEDFRKPAPGPLTRQYRQNPVPLASCG